MIYLLTHPSLRAHKIGITGTGTKRLAEFKKNGWKVFKTILISTGEVAWFVEQACLTRLRRIGIATSFLSRADMPRGGYTETMDANAISLSELESLVREEITSYPDDPEAAPVPAI